MYMYAVPYTINGVCLVLWKEKGQAFDQEVPALRNSVEKVNFSLPRLAIV